MDIDRDNGRTADDRLSPQYAATAEVQALAAAQAGQLPPPANAQAVSALAGPVALPEGVSLDQIRVSGRDLIVTLPDGTQMVILDGAIFVPQLVIDGVQIPPANIAALLIGNEPQPAAGSPQSSGGNFVAAEGDIGDPFNLGDLLPPTELSFPPFEQQEIFPAAPEDEDDDQPVDIITIPGPGEPGTVVDEAGLGIDDRDGETPGSNEPANVETTQGVMTYTAPDGPATVSINNVVVTQVGQTIQGQHGILTITSIADGQIGYSYAVTDNGSGDNVTDSFAVTVTDVDGDTDSGTLTITIVDDVPQALNDIDSVTEDGPLVADGNVFTGSGGEDANGSDGVADTPGADGATVTAISFGQTGGTIGSPVPGAYGTLTLNTDGSYVYTLNAENGVVQGLDSTESLTEQFSYTITDGDGDMSSATLTITIAGSDDGVRIGGLDGQGAEEILFEANLGDGSSPDAAALTQTGTFTLNAVDGVSTISINGQTIFTGDTFTAGAPISNAYGSLTITGFTPVMGSDGDVIGGTVSYSYVLNDNMLLHTGGNGGSLTQSYTVVVTDTDGSSDTASLDVQVVDDVPTAAANSNTVDEGATLEVDAASGVLSNDTDGADGFAGGDGVVGVRAAGDDTTSEIAGNVGSAIEGLYGTLTLHADGSYIYVSNPNVVPPAGASDVFVYTIEDGDGDHSTATLTIDIADAGLAARTDSITVDEAALDSVGSNSGSDGETATGTLTDNVSGGAGPFTFALTGNGAGSFGTLTLNPNGSYSYTLTSPVDGITADDGALPLNGAESFEYEVTDANGNTTTSTITINIVDDVPTAFAEQSQSVAEDADAAIGGNVLDNDVRGADGASLTSVTIDGTTTNVAAIGTTPVTTSLGTYTFTANGNWTFAPVSNQANAAGIDASFSYTITDGDGDTSSAQQPITVLDGAEPQVGKPVTLTLDDQNLSDGSTPAGADSATGTVTFLPGSDAIASIAFAADVSSLGGNLDWTRVSDTQIVGKDGGTIVVTLDLVRVGDTGQVTATLNNNYDSHPGINADDLQTLGSVGVVATDTDGDTATGAVNVEVSDDLPVVTASQPGEDAMTVDETDLGSNDTADFGSLFAIDYNADGPAAANPVVYTLGVVSAGVNSGLVDSATGSDVLLRLTAGGVVEGYVATQPSLVVFTVSVDGAGIVTLDQQRAIFHSPDSGADQPAFLTADNILTLTATVEDADGDTDSATISIGNALRFEDDGPSIDASVVDADTVLLTTQDVQTIGGLSDTAVSTANFSGAFGLVASDHGADGAGSTAWNYSLNLTGVLAAGLSSNGAAINLFVNGGVVFGSTAATLGDVDPANTIFTLGVDSGTGVVTLTQFAEIDHLPNGDTAAPYDDQFATLASGLVQLVGIATITDKDGDTASETVALDLGGNVQFADDGPSISAAGAIPTLTVDESALSVDANASFVNVFESDFGADGAGKIVYTLGINAGATGLVDSLTGQAVVLSLEGEQVIGRAGVNGEIVFALTEDGAGGVYLDQKRAVAHDIDGSASAAHDDPKSLLAANLITLTATITDGDGDQASATIDLGDKLTFKDDGPSASSNAVVQLDDDVLANGNDGGTGDDPDAANTSGTLGHGFGADGGSIAFLTSGAPSGFSYELSGSNLLVKQGGTTVLTVTLNAATGDYVVTQNAPILHDSAQNENNQTFVLNYQVTDGDGDTAAGTLSINVDDDIPIATNDLAFVVEGGPLSTGNVLDNDQPGADGPLVVSSVSGGSLGAPIVGSYGTLTLNADGSYKYTPNASVPTNSVDNFTYLVVDKDGDTKPALLSFVFKGDANTPNGGNVSVTVDDEGLSGGNSGGTGDYTGVPNEAVVSGNLGFSYGGDGAAGSGAFAFANGSVTVGTETVNYVWNAGTNTLTATGPRGILFTVTVNPANGDYTVTLVDNVLHTVGGNENDAGPIALNYALLDSDGSPANGVLNISFDDDTPNAYNIAPEVASGVNTGTDYTDAGNLLHLPSIGADGLGTLTFNVTNGTQAMGLDGKALTFEGQNIYYTVNSDDPSILEARTSATPGAGTLIFKIDLDQPSGTYAFSQYEQISILSTQNITSLSSVGGGNVTAKAIDVPSSPYDLVLSTQAGNTVNTNSTQIGVGSGQSMDSGEHIRIDFVKDSFVTGSGGNAELHFGEYYTANSYRQDVSGLSGPQRADFVVRAVTVSEASPSTTTEADGDKVFYGDGNDSFLSSAVTSIEIYNAAGTLVAPANYSGLGISVTAVANGWQILNLPNNYDFKIISSTPFNAVQVEALAGTDTFKLGFISIEAFVVGGTSFSVPISLTDADGDTVSNSIAVNLSAPVAPVAIDLDHDGVEYLALSAGVTHDYGSGEVNTAWVAPDDGLLAHAIGEAYDVVFTDDAAGATTDLDGIRLAYDSNNDGFLTADDAEFSSFGVWQDANSNGVVDAGEFHSLTDLGITSVGLVSDGQSNMAANGDVLVHGEATYTINGETGAVADVAFATTSTPTATQLDERTLLNTGLNQALVAASLIATVEQAAADSSDTTPSDAVEQDSTVAAPVVETSAPTVTSDESVPESSLLDDPASDHSVSTPAAETHQAQSEGDESSLSSLQDTSSVEDSSAPVQDDHAVTADAPPPPMPVDLTPMMMAAMQVAEGEQPVDLPKALPAILADALAGGTADGPDIDALLNALPQAEPVGGATPAAPATEAIHDFALAAPAFHFDLAMMSHDAVAATTHA
ncbi:DUF5801 repeats-in-toxin domain-containing protein [Rhizorhapis suberifaciens]|uniref:VCBS repeat-containing protein n=1 Tax=Rhizorhapis suberifaciens TaxID=13656 RepID=A0A840HW10_9SPHN|nr:DUF5801 repeats-in-toxin domain-containing protein [Rhizorhapis suberifaciens]MBB4642143.1 VCBS repeat-containing protein [Rhizorhapis suberifaciens]